MLLYIEDRADVRASFVMFLEALNLVKDKSFLVATSAAEARTLWEQHKDKITAIISDDDIGDGKGSALLNAWIKEHPQIRYAMVCSLKPDVLEEGIRFGAKGSREQTEIVREFAQFVAAKSLGNLRTSHEGQTEAPSI